MTSTPTKSDHQEGPFVPSGTVALLSKLKLPERHPGLQLDKFSAGGTQLQNQGPALTDVCQTTGDAKTLAWALGRRREMLQALGATRFTARTEGPLTLHLSRGSALENAGICLHPLYGFCYLPGSGLKGMARAWALTEGGVGDHDPTFVAIFGQSPNPKRNVDGTAGAVVFHDAWPLRWPKLIRDVVTNHHPRYYQDKEDKEPPGDWMDPVPVQFLAIGPGTEFGFALSARPGADPARVAQAAAWLKAALAINGAGAKTNAGYGTLVPVEDPRPTPAAERSVTVTLELVSPAFFAGAEQGKDDCDLRPATLRGLLRWWWRTLHAGQLQVDQLKAREALIWGDTKRGGAVRVTVTPLHGARSTPFDKEAAARTHRLPSPQKGHTQALFYASYGMDETVNDRAGGGRQRRQRHHIVPGAKWTVTLSVRSTGADMQAQGALREAEAALWLLCRYGAAGSKARKGFGCFADLELPDSQSWVQMATSRPAKIAAPETPALEQALMREWPVADQTAWQTLHRAWTAIEALASRMKHRPDKVALGLPRQIHGPLKSGPLQHQSREDWQPPTQLSAAKGRRHAAPYHLHVGRTTDGNAVLRFTGFPAKHLPDVQKSRDMLDQVIAALDAEFAAPHGGGPRVGASRCGPLPQGHRTFPCSGRYQGEKVMVLNEAGNQYRVDFGDGDIDFVPRSAVSFD